MNEEQIKEGSAADSHEPVAAKGPAKPLDPKTIGLVVGVIVLAIIGYYARSWFVAATVNGSPVSRFAVISEMERTAGKQTLDAIITRKLIAAEAKNKGLDVSDEEVNSELKKIEDDVTGQGDNFDDVLAAQGLTRERLATQIRVQKQVEKLLGDKITVTDQEVDDYLKNQAITVPAGQEEMYKEQVKAQLRMQKMNTFGPELVGNLKTSAKINYWVNY